MEFNLNALAANAMESNSMEPTALGPNTTAFTTTGENSGNGSLPPAVPASSRTTSRRVRPPRPPSVFARHGYP